MTGAVYNRAITPCTTTGMEKYGGHMRTQTMVGEDYVSPGLSSTLEKFYQKAAPADKAKCLELLTAINIQKHIQSPKPALSRAQTPAPQSYREYTPQPPRPKTAMDVPKGHRERMTRIYQTTYKREFSAPAMEDTLAHRPSSTKGSFGARYQLNGPVGETTYNQTFCPADFRRAHTQILPNELSRNNPQPNQKFMVWRYPRRVENVERTQFPEGLSYEAMEKICRGVCRSTYESDYTGIPQGFQFPESNYSLPQDWKSRVPYSLSSSMRHSYQRPDKHDQLAGNTTRFGCNKNREKFAVGGVPEASSPHLHLKPRTTYDREYQEPYGPPAQDIRDVSKRLGADTLQRNLDAADPQQRETLKEMLRSIRTPPVGGRTNQRTSAPPCEEFNPTWLSKWSGPA